MEGEGINVGGIYDGYRGKNISEGTRDNELEANYCRQRVTKEKEGKRDFLIINFFLTHSRKV